MIYNPGLTRVAVKMLKPHHSGSEHAEADLLSEYNLLKEVGTVNLRNAQYYGFGVSIVLPFWDKWMSHIYFGSLWWCVCLSFEMIEALAEHKGVSRSDSEYTYLVSIDLGVTLS